MYEKKSLLKKEAFYSLHLLHLFNETAAVCIKEFFQIANALLQFFTNISILYQDTVLAMLESNGRGQNIFLFCNGYICRNERLVANQIQTIRVIDQGVSCNTGNFLICFCKTAINDKQFTVGFNGAFAF